MPFDYLYSKVPKCYLDASEKAEAQYIKEIEERAGLLYRLHYSKEESLNRIRGNLKWDWECHRSPDYVKKIEKKLEEIVEQVFSKPRPPEKGRKITAADLKTLPSD